MDYQHKSRKRGKDKESERRKRNGGYSKRHIRQCIAVKGTSNLTTEKQVQNKEELNKKQSYQAKLEKHHKSHGKKNKNKTKQR